MLKDVTISGHLATFWPLLKIFLASKNALKKAKKRLKQAKKRLKQAKKAKNNIIYVIL